MNQTMLIPKLNIKNITPQKLGYILKDGTINFQSESSAFNFARNMVDKALKAKEPFERMVIWKGPRVHLIADGTAKGVNVPNVTIPVGTSSMHGHIIDMPLNVQDYITHMAGYMDVSYALCPSGKYSKFTTLPGEDINKISTKNKIAKMYRKEKTIKPIVNLKSGLFSFKQLFNSLSTELVKKIKNPKAYKYNGAFGESLERKCLKKGLTIDKNSQLDMWKKNSGKKSGVIFETTLDKSTVSDDDVARYSKAFER